MTKLRFTMNVTGVFDAESYAQAQSWLINQLMANEQETHMNIQRIDLVRWSDPESNKPINAATGEPIIENDE